VKNVDNTVVSEMLSRHVKRMVKSEVTTYSKARRMCQCCIGSLKAVAKHCDSSPQMSWQLWH